MKKTWKAPKVEVLPITQTNNTGSNWGNRCTTPIDLDDSSMVVHTTPLPTHGGHTHNHTVRWPRRR